MTPTNHHLFLVCIPAWGHSRPGLGHAIKLLQGTTNLIVTFPTGKNWIKNVDDEIAKYVPDIHDPIRDRLRIVQISERETEVPLLGFMEGLFPLCASLFTSTPYQQGNGNVLSSIQPPDICLLDLAFWDLLCFIRSFNPKVPVLTLLFANTTATIQMMGPEELGGKGEVSAKAKLLAEKTGKSVEDALIELYLPEKGEVINLIGLSKVYDYECHVKLTPQMIPSIIGMYPKIFNLFRECDGVVTTTPHIFEPEGQDAVKAYYEASGRSFYAAGPATPTTVDQVSLTDKSTGVKAFLDRMLHEHGENSLIYISFGSLYWPTHTEAAWKSFEIIHDRKIPMIISHNDIWGRPSFPESLRAKFEASDIVLISEWAPQNLILGHKASYWMVLNTLRTEQCIRIYITRHTNACFFFRGRRSVLTHPFPRIAWPVDGLDQNVNAMFIGELKHKIGYELLEVLQRDESKPFYRGYKPSGTMNAIENELVTILQKAFGPDGAEKRRNVEIFKEKMKHSLEDEDGSAQLELRRFIKDYLS